MAEKNLSRFLRIVSETIGLDAVRTVFELGARDGTETVIFGERFPAARIFTFECNPATIPRCRHAVAGLKNVQLVEKAVCDRNGDVTFYPINPQHTITTWRDGNPGASSQFKASGKYPVERYGQDEITVPSTTLESFIEQNGIPPADLLWMDIQGAELLALKGMGKYLKCVRMIHTEVEFLEIYEHQPLFKDVKRYLNEQGFRLIEFTNLEQYSGDAVFISVREARTLGQRASFFVRDRLLSLWKRHLPLLTNRGPIGRVRGVYRDLFVCEGCPRRFRRGFSIVWFKKVLPLLVSNNKGRSDLELDVIIPAVEKDLGTLPYAIEGVRRNLLHPIRKIFVVAPESSKTKELCDRLNVDFVCEQTVAPVSKDDIDFVVDGIDRSGWLLQQLIKLNADRVAMTENFLVLDADTVLIKPQWLETRGRIVIMVSEEHHRPYYRTYEKLLGYPPQSLLSFVCHYMIFNKHILMLLREAIQKRGQKPWAQAIVGSIDRNEASSFSEYETYGNFLCEIAAGKVVRRYSNNRRLAPEEVSDISRYSAKADRFLSLSFHVYE
jgi:FkbM family methyltransferase